MSGQCIRGLFCSPHLTFSITPRLWYTDGSLPDGANLRNENQNRKTIMSQHRSLRAAAALGAKRNVLKRFERIDLLKKRGEWKPGDRVVNLRKTKPPA